jgi:hypothetical protein
MPGLVDHLYEVLGAGAKSDKKMTGSSSVQATTDLGGV